ncbi:E3 ubiquitin-protein ligase XERICO [Spatholobus suberectus]|nr:E3 ubiquitin-protein ligase XERICO [Spatholobus suberectus]
MNSPGSEEYVDCAVCLRKIGEGDGEIRVLRCEHVFHKGCLDRWVGFKNATCPLCRGSWVQQGLSLTLERRGSVGSKQRVTHSRDEVLLFQFCSVQKHGDI